MLLVADINFHTLLSERRETVVELLAANANVTNRFTASIAGFRYMLHFVIRFCFGYITLVVLFNGFPFFFFFFLTKIAK